MNVQRRNDVSIYCLSAGETIPEWMGDRARRNLSKTNESVRRRIELLQDFQMPASSSKLVSSRDGRYIMAAGTYPPRLRCYDTHELTMKFERYLNAEVVDMVMLGDDYGKLALLLDDRTIDFHAHYGAHESIRVPTFGRAMDYEPSTCDLLVAAKGSSVYRVNLEEGKFVQSWEFQSDATGTCLAVSPLHPLAAVGCDDSTVRLWDSRSPDMLKPFLQLNVGPAVKGYGYADEHNALVNEITSVAHDPSGLHMAVGTGGGLVALYDVRSSRPLFVQEHKIGLPIHTVKFHSGSGMVLSSDEKLIKAWRYKSSENASIKDASNALGSLMVNVEGNGRLSNFVVAGDEGDPTGSKSGVILCATDQPKMDVFYVPALGVAPTWCSFLENITEELEERDLNRDGSGMKAGDLVRNGSENVFENYKFVSREDLEKLGVSNLIGTPMLRGYMHGFFMDINLYNRVKAVANPFEYEEYQKKKLKEKLDAKQSSRITARKENPRKAVNPDLAERLEDKAARQRTKAGKAAKDILQDDRFGSLFTNPDFEIDQDDEEFKLRNPSGVAVIQRKAENMDSDDDDDEEEDDMSGSFSSQDGDSDDDRSADPMMDSEEEDELGVVPVRGEEYESMKQKKQKPPKIKRKKAKKVDKEELESYEDALAFNKGKAVDEEKEKRRLEKSMPLGKRTKIQDKELEDAPRVRVQGGSKEATFIPKDTKRKLQREEESRQALRGSKKRDRRSMKDIRR